MKYAKRHPIRDKAYLDHLRDQSCVVTGERGCDPMHLGTRGTGLKSSDDECLPVCHRLHDLGHREGEVSMFRQCAPDWLIRDALRAYARECYQQWKDTA